MSQDFRPHPVLVNYEASSDGVVRLKKPVGWVSKMGYLMLAAGKKNYHCHRIIYGPIKNGFVIDHKNGIKIDNHSSNLQAISQRDNLLKSNAGRHSKRPRGVKSFDLETNEERIFQSMYAAGNHFEICIPSVQRIAENITKSAVSKKNGHKIKFIYI